MKLIQLLKELEINNPLQIKFEDVKRGNKYEIKWSDDGNIRSDIVECLGWDENGDEIWFNGKMLSNLDYWNEVFPEGNPWVQFFKNDIINIKQK